MYTILTELCKVTYELFKQREKIMKCKSFKNGKRNITIYYLISLPHHINRNKKPTLNISKSTAIEQKK